MFISLDRLERGRLIAAAADGSKKAITERKKQRVVVVKMLRELGHWVEANCNDEASVTVA